MEARITRFRVLNQTGSVSLSKTNFWIELAPYFFPLYAILILLAYATFGIFWDLSPYRPLWFGAIGCAWGFHISFTISAIARQQPDIRSNGYVFSYSLIYAVNIVLLFATLGILGKIRPLTLFHDLLLTAWRVYAAILKWSSYIISRATALRS